MTNITNITNITIKVVSQKGFCACGHKVGDEFVFEKTTPVGICPWAFCALYPYLTVLNFGASFPWEKDPDKALVACSDPENPVVFELSRVKRK